MDNLEKETAIEFFRSSGPGGQNVDKRDTAVRLRHIPTGVIIEEQSQRSQWQNRKIAFTRLREKLDELNTSEKTRVKTKIPKREKEKRLDSKHKRTKAIQQRQVLPKELS